MHKMLEGFKVVDMTLAIAGPACTKLLAEWGADVIHIEGFKGDMNRTIDNEFPNMNKRAITVDVKKPEGLALIYKLVAEADFFVTNFRPQAIKKMKIDYETLKAIKPALIYGVITGFGEVGPDADKPGYDTVAYWARTGMMCDFTQAGSGPVVPPSAVGDITAGIDLAAGLLAAYIHKQKTGLGEKVMVSLLAHGLYSNHDAFRKVQFGVEYPMTRKNPNKPLINTFPTKDGKWISLTILHPDKFMTPLFRIIGREDLIGKPEYGNYDMINERGPEIIRILDEGFMKFNRDELIPLLLAQDIPASPVCQTKDAVCDPQALANNYIFEHTYWNGKKVMVPASPIQFGDILPAADVGAPLLGQHTREVMAEYGYTREQIEDHIARAIVGDVVEGSNRDYFSDHLL